MKLHVKNALKEDANEKIYPLMSEEDFNKLFTDFPQLRESMNKYNDLRLIAKDMAKYLNSHHIYAWITEG